MMEIREKKKKTMHAAMIFSSMLLSLLLLLLSTTAAMTSLETSSSSSSSEAPPRPLKLDIDYIGVPLPQQSVAKGAHQEYHLKLSKMGDVSTDDIFAIQVTPYSGDADLCVVTNTDQLPAEFSDMHCKWSSAHGHGDVVNIPRSHASWPTGDNPRFVIGVYGRTRAEFVINTWLTGTHIVLEDGLPQNAWTPRRKYTYFKYTLPEATDFHIAVSANTGDPDLYVSTVEERPTKDSSPTTTWIAREWSTDVIDIRTTDPKYKSSGVYYIGVHGFWDTSFTISVALNTSYTVLPEGYPLLDFVEQGHYRYYKFFMAQQGYTQSWTLNSAYGDADLYVKEGSEAYKGEPKPHKDAGGYDWKSRSLSTDTVFVENAKSDTWYYGAAYGYKKSEYRIVGATSATSLVLQDGQQHSVTALKEGMTYFRFDHRDSVSGLTFTASATGAGAIPLAMYMSTEISDPEKSKHDRAGEQQGTQTSMYLPPGSPTGTYYLSVVYEDKVNFTMAAITNQTITHLRDNQPLYSIYVPQDYYRYFVFEDPGIADSDLIISVTPGSTGDVDLYVSNKTVNPTTKNYVWKSENSRYYGGADTVVIHAAELKKMAGHRFYIGVLGRYDSRFTIVAYAGSRTVDVTDGQPITGSVRRQSARFYRYAVNRGFEGININLRITSPASDIDLYADYNNEKPSSRDAKWRSMKIGDDFIFIDKAEEAHGPYLYIGVYGYSHPSDLVDGANFRLVVSQEYQTIPTNAGPSTQVVPRGSLQQMHSEISPMSDYVLITSTLISGRTRLYVNNNGTVPAGPNAHMWSSDDWPGNALLIRKTDPNFRTGVWSFSVESVDNSDYHVSVVTDWPPLGGLLRESIPQLAIAPKESFTLFAFDLPQNIGEDYHLNVNIMQGAADIYIGDSPFGLREHSLFNSTGPNDRIMVLDRRVLQSQMMFTVYIGCYGVDTDASFILSITRAGAAKFLGTDQPQMFQASPLHDLYFSVVAPHLNHSQLTVTTYLESCDSHAPPALYGSAVDGKPSPKNATATSRSESKWMQKMVGTLPETPQGKTGGRMYYMSMPSSSTQERGAPANAQLFSIYTTIDGQIEQPIIPEGKHRLGAVQPSGPKKIKLRVPRAQRAARFPKKPLFYELYAVDVDALDYETRRRINMETACGVQLASTRIASVSELEADNDDKDESKEFVFIEVDIDDTKTYEINVLVHNNNGILSAYERAWVIDGQFVGNLFNPWSFFSPLSVGFFMLLILFLGLGAYFGIGAIVQFARGRRGIYVIPNVSFWMDLPHLLLDGFRLIGSVFTLKLRGKKAPRYSTLDENGGDDSVNVDATGFDTTSAPAHVRTARNYDSAEEEEEIEKGLPAAPQQPTSSRGGYGAI